MLIKLLKSSWLRDALSEFDPSCDKLSFITNPVVNDLSSYRVAPKPLLRITAVGTFGTTEVRLYNASERIYTYI